MINCRSLCPTHWLGRYIIIFGRLKNAWHKQMDNPFHYVLVHYRRPSSIQRAYTILYCIISLVWHHACDNECEYCCVEGFENLPKCFKYILKAKHNRTLCIEQMISFVAQSICDARSYSRCKTLTVIS